MSGSRGPRPAPAPRRPRPAAPGCRCHRGAGAGDPGERAPGLPRTAPSLPRSPGATAGGELLGGSHPRRGPRLGPPPRPIAPGAQAPRRARSAWAPRFSPQSFIKSRIHVSRLLGSRCSFPVKTTRADLQSAVVFRKTVYTPSARPPPLLEAPPCSSSDSEWPGRRGARRARRPGFLPPRSPASGDLQGGGRREGRCPGAGRTRPRQLQPTVGRL